MGNDIILGDQAELLTWKWLLYGSKLGHLLFYVRL